MVLFKVSENCSLSSKYLLESSIYLQVFFSFEVNAQFLSVSFSGFCPVHIPNNITKM